MTELILKGFKPPFKFDKAGILILDSEDNYVADIRSWGRLSQQFGDNVAIQIQESLGEYIVEKLNERTNQDGVLRFTGERKYIITKEDEVLLFSSSLDHSSVCKKEDVFSAGFFKIFYIGGDINVSTYGYSYSLNKTSHRKDSQTIKNFIKYGIG